MPPVSSSFLSSSPLPLSPLPLVSLSLLPLSQVSFRLARQVVLRVLPLKLRRDGAQDLHPLDDPVRALQQLHERPLRLEFARRDRLGWSHPATQDIHPYTIGSRQRELGRTLIDPYLVYPAIQVVKADDSLLIDTFVGITVAMDCLMRLARGSPWPVANTCSDRDPV